MELIMVDYYDFGGIKGDLQSVFSDFSVQLDDILSGATHQFANPLAAAANSVSVAAGVGNFGVAGSQELEEDAVAAERILHVDLADLHHVQFRDFRDIAATQDNYAEIAGLGTGGGIATRSPVVSNEVRTTIYTHELLSIKKVSFMFSKT
ncbi:unnamed protein product [Lupinus luteus]|uniref:Uncharacterized protein n=1 Tax=Lupinus luteus TaxID=3873 RepID=A0AAV1WAP2_LUPLU